MDITALFNNFFASEPKTTQEVVGKVIQEAPKQPSVVPEQKDYYKQLSMVESSGGTNVRSKTSSALGPFQFTKETWQDYTKQMGVDFSLDDRLDYKKSRQVVEHFTEKNRELLSKVLERKPNNTETYMAHKLGRVGATKFFNAEPTTTIDKVVSKQAMRANKNVFYRDTGKPRTVSEVYEIFHNKFK